MAGIEAVCFDLDGTLCLPEESDHEFHAAVFERAGVDPIFTPRDLRAVDTADIVAGTGITDFFRNLYRETVRRVDTDVEPDSPLVDELGSIAGDRYDPTAVRWRPGAEAALEDARERYHVGLVTNGRRATQEGKLEALGIADAFDVTVTCGPETGIAGKPAPDPFERVVAALSARQATTVHVGDSHPEDVTGAAAAGLQSVWVPVDRPHEDLPTNPDPAPTHRVDSPAAIPDLL